MTRKFFNKFTLKKHEIKIFYPFLHMTFFIFTYDLPMTYLLKRQFFTHFFAYDINYDYPWSYNNIVRSMVKQIVVTHTINDNSYCI